ncbi:hypothetical protein ACJJTC_019857, partial [Scirpophaga incertulas]
HAWDRVVIASRGYYISPNGTCVLPEECPTDPPCDNDPNQRFSACASPCQPTCDFPVPACNRTCHSPGCECLPGFLRNDYKCIPLKSCPGASQCKANEEFSSCKAECPNDYCPVNDSRGIIACDPSYPCPSGCTCKYGYLRKSETEPICIKATNCPPVKCTRPNEVWSPRVPKCLVERCEDLDDPSQACYSPYRDIMPRCICKKGYYRNSEDICVPKSQCPSQCSVAARCRPTCAVPNPTNCPVVLNKPTENVDGCQCKQGYILSETNGRCIKIEECPQDSCNGDPNAIVKACPWACDPTCARPGMANCEKLCKPVGCQCKPGYIRSSEDGSCILADDCPGGNPCGANSSFTECAFDCPNDYCPNEDNWPKMAVCDAPRDCKPGCRCNLNYRMLNRNDERCIFIAECPPVKCKGKNEKFAFCPNICHNERCEDVNEDEKVCPTLIFLCNPKCICKSNFYRNSAGHCVPAKNCAGYNPCMSRCAPTCDTETGITLSYCSTPDNGCCKKGYILNKRGGKCIKIKDCPRPKCNGPNEIWSSEKTKCNGDYCRSVDDPAVPCPSLSEKPVKCVCADNYYRNERASRCSVPPRCRQTCTNPNPDNCPIVLNAAAENVDGCECQEGYILNETNGRCIKIEECPQNGCNGDPNAIVKACPWACEPTCARPGMANCEKLCMPVGCQCKPGYIRSSEDGSCILADDCPGGNPCGVNGTFAECGFRCPNQYCPKDDRRLICKPPRDCKPGCVCKFNHRRLSRTDDRCILTTDCPPGSCRQPNEKWGSCPNVCLNEKCQDVNDAEKICPTLILNCDPKCVCKSGYYRNSTNYCVPAQSCAGYNPCMSRCAPTCEYPNPPNCDTLDNGCCQEGYILNKRGGECIRINQCPLSSCNGDPNARVKQCPQPCPSTCSQPNEIDCKQSCKDVGCECSPGFILSEDGGGCIKPTECPGGNPCKENEQFVPCTFSCPDQFCPRNEFQVACMPPLRCHSGCTCKRGYLKSTTDRECIAISDCPPVNCTRPNEIWSTLKTRCTAEFCKDVDQPAIPCDSLGQNVGRPRCVCIDNYYRNNKNGACVPADECRKENAS